MQETEGVGNKKSEKGSKEEKKSMPPRCDFAVISQKGKAMSVVERLMKQYAGTVCDFKYPVIRVYL